MKKIIPRTAKTAVSLRHETYEKGEKLRRKAGMSRSALYAAALESFCSAWEVKEKEARYAASYEQHPENAAELDAFYKASLRGFDKEVW